MSNIRTEKTLLDHTLEYYQRGWSLIPIKPGTKKPAIRSWKQYQDTRPSEEMLRNWFADNDKSIAVILGEVSNGLACRDFDTMGEYRLWASVHPPLAKMPPTVQTANGMHVYFEGHIQGIKHISNGELRGSGGYCLLPPSVHPDGDVYQWVNPLFNGNLLAIDPELAGFVGNVTEQAEQSEQSEQTEQSEAMLEGGEAEKAIIETLPLEFGTRNRHIFEFARAIKSLPQYADAEPRQLRKLVEAWHKRALPKIRTKEFEETWIDFLKAWPRIKYVKGEEPMTQIFNRAIELEPPKAAVQKYPDNKELQTLTALCRELQRASGQEPFYLGVRTGGRLMKVTPMTISRWLFLLIEDGILEEVCKGGTAETVRKATRFRYLAN